MGLGRSYEIVEYRKKIWHELCTSPEIIRLFGLEGVANPETIIPYKFSFPHEYIPEVRTNTERLINFDINAYIDQHNSTYKDLSIYFWVVCHIDVERYVENGFSYLWYDKAVCALDDIFTGNNILGVGKTTITDNVAYSAQQVFKGRLVRFTVKDFTNGLKNGGNRLTYGR